MRKKEEWMFKGAMRKKEEWMFKGAIVLALNKKGIITKMQENNLDGIDYVYKISVKLEGEKTVGYYHPTDVGKLVVENIIRIT